MGDARPAWKVMLTRQAEKALYRLPKPLLRQVDQALLALAKNPHPPESHRLASYDHLYRLPVSEWRITYTIEDKQRLVLIVEITPKEQPKRYQLEEEGDESLSFKQSSEQDLSIESETFDKSPMNQTLEDYVYRGAPRLLKPKPPEKIRVLIVDDLAETRENLHKLLFFEPDIEVVGSATTGEAAVQTALELQPDIVLMDIVLPGIDGITACEEITKKIPSTQVIVMSVHGEADYLRRSLLAGAREFLIKPFSGDELMTSIRRVYQPAAFKEQYHRPEIRPTRDAFRDLKERLQAKLIAELTPSIDVSQADVARQVIQAKFDQVLGQENIILSRSERIRLFEVIVTEILIKMSRMKVNFKIGQKVQIIEGPFEDFVGIIEEIDPERARVRVLVSFFGQDKSIEFDFSQVEPN